MNILDPVGRLTQRPKKHEPDSDEFDQYAQEAMYLGYDPIDIEKKREVLRIFSNEGLWDDIEDDSIEDEEQ